MLIFAYHFKNRQKYENELSNLQSLITNYIANLVNLHLT